MSDESEALSLPPARAIAFFDGKVSIGTDRWTDVWKAGHDRAFMVAGVQAEDLLGGIRGAIAKALREGTTLAEFRRDLAPLMQRLGWQSRGKGYLGWRTRLVYETNLRSAYAAGAYEQATDPDVLAALPFWRYRHSGARDPRPEHQAWDGTVLRADDAWWRTHHPPNGWGCGCWVEPLSPWDLERLGKVGPDEAPPVVTRPWTDPASGRTQQVPLGIDPGWDYNVGASWRQASDLPEPPQRPPAGWLPEAPPAPQPPAEAAAAVAAATRRGPRLPAPAAPAQPRRSEAWQDAALLDEPMRDAFAAWAATLSATEQRALTSYKTGLGREINDILRGRADPDPATSWIIAALSGALARARAPVAIRALRGGGEADAAVLWGVAAGDTVRFGWFLSGSLDVPTAEGYRERNGGPRIELRVPPGALGVAYVHPFPVYRYRQYEVLAAPNVVWRVIEVARDFVVIEWAGGGE